MFSEANKVVLMPFLLPLSLCCAFFLAFLLLSLGMYLFARSEHEIRWPTLYSAELWNKKWENEICSRHISFNMLSYVNIPFVFNKYLYIGSIENTQM